MVREAYLYRVRKARSPPGYYMRAHLTKADDRCAREAADYAIITTRDGSDRWNLRHEKRHNSKTHTALALVLN